MSVCKAIVLKNDIVENTASKENIVNIFLVMQTYASAKNIEPFLHDS